MAAFIPLAPRVIHGQFDDATAALYRLTDRLFQAGEEAYVCNSVVRVRRRRSGCLAMQGSVG